MPTVLQSARVIASSLVGLVALGLLVGCGDEKPREVAPTPLLGDCRLLDADDIAGRSNDTDPVPCTEPHTAETYAVGDLPVSLHDVGYHDEELGKWAYSTCSKAFQEFLGADESLVMRTILTWAWFRPSEADWEDGARWYRCDAIGGGEQTTDLVELPTTAKGLLLGRPDDQWMVCAEGATVAGSVKVPCSEPHDWRAVTTISLGGAEDPYPGDKAVQNKSRDFCSSSVGAWLNYPADYDYGYTWFREAEWSAGNRRSVCWAKTAQ